MQLTQRVRSMVDVAYREGLKFLTVGGVAYVVDTGLFNLLRLTILDEKPITAKFISAAVATLVAWQGNRSWTFRHRRSSPPLRELAQFIIVNAVGMAIMMGCLAISHYVLGFTSPLADNISANVVGLALSMVVRFWLYRTWVFSGGPAVDPDVPDAVTDTQPDTAQPGPHAARTAHGAAEDPVPAGDAVDQHTQRGTPRFERRVVDARPERGGSRRKSVA